MTTSQHKPTQPTRYLWPVHNSYAQKKEQPFFCWVFLRWFLNGRSNRNEKFYIHLLLVINNNLSNEILSKFSKIIYSFNHKIQQQNTQVQWKWLQFLPKLFLQRIRKNTNKHVNFGIFLLFFTWCACVFRNYLHITQ